MDAPGRGLGLRCMRCHHGTMARRWQIISVELLSGRGQILVPPPGRDLIVPPSTTFEQLGVAIDLALARWDLGHLRDFTLADGTRIIDDATDLELGLGGFSGGALIDRVLRHNVRVKDHVDVGEVFRYVFDFGDDWTCRCTVTRFGDPEQEVGVVVQEPTAIWGWGALPDQYGRVRHDDEDFPGDDAALTAKQARAEENEVNTFLMTFGQVEPERLDLRAVRVARASDDAAALIAALTGVNADHALQQIGQALLEVWDGIHGPGRPRGSRAVRGELASVMATLSSRLRWRDEDGDAILSAELLARIQGHDPVGRPLPVDLEELADTMASYGDVNGGYLDLDTGQVLLAAMVSARGINLDKGDDEFGIEPGRRWVVVDDSAKAITTADRRGFIHHLQSSGRQDERAAASTLAAAMQAQAARGFDDTIDELDLAPVWVGYRDDRRWGRAREALAAHGVRPTAGHSISEIVG